jgi:Domain of unknown function (DUF3854)
MTNFSEKQLKELVASAIDSELAELNIDPLDSDRALDDIFYALPLEERKNDGRVSDKWLRKYEHVRKHGGLSFHGMNPIDGSRSDCISFKPDRPLSPDRKYEQPPHSQNQVFYPAVTDRIWQLVADRFGVPKSNNKFENFWQWVSANNLPIIITEGCKKALSGLSIGLPCVALTGIWTGVTASRNENGKTESYDLILGLKYLFGRQIYIAFDRDQRISTIKQVAHARSVLAQQLIEIGCECYSMRWDDEYKGLDDLIAGAGIEAVEKSLIQAQQLTGAVYTRKNRPSASEMADRIAKECKDILRFDYQSKIWQLYRQGVWESLVTDEIENFFYRRIIEDIPDLSSHNYVVTVMKFTRATIYQGK